MTHDDRAAEDDDLLAFAQDEIGAAEPSANGTEAAADDAFNFSPDAAPAGEGELIDLADQSSDAVADIAHEPAVADEPATDADTAFSFTSEPDAPAAEPAAGDQTFDLAAVPDPTVEESAPAPDAEPEAVVGAEAAELVPANDGPLGADEPDPAPTEFLDLTTPAEPPEFAPAEPEDPVARRRADVDAKQAAVARHLAEMGCEGAILFTPAHVAWFTGGMNVRGLIAETERPGVYTNGRQRWLVSSNVDGQRLFDEELDQLGFQLKEWQWPAGRAPLIGELLSGRKIACDRPFPGMPLIADRLRADLRPLLPSDMDRYLALGQLVAHAVEATTRTLTRGQTEQEVAGQVAHRLLHHGADLVGVSVAADDRGRRFRRSGFTAPPVDRVCPIQATGTRDGLHATVSRTVCFGKPSAPLRDEFSAACKVSAAYRAMGAAGRTVTHAAEAGRRVLKGTPFEHEWRHSQPGYGAGWHAAEELRRMGQDEPFVAGQAVVWQARVGSAAVVDTVIAQPDGVTPVTPPDGWPFKRIKIADQNYDVPDLLVRTF